MPAAGRGLELDEGDLTVRAARQALGERFTVRSPQALTEVIGARFRPRCAKAMSLLVDEGNVSFRRLGDGPYANTAGGHAIAGHVAPMSADLVAWWPLDDGSGAVARDASGQGA